MASTMAKSDQMTLPVPSFPDELMEIIFHHFSGVSIGRAHSVCKKWNGILCALATSSDIWFHCCVKEIPKMTLMQMCNHPLEPGCRSRTEWKDIYVRWRLFTGRRLFHSGKLLQKKVIPITTPSFSTRRPPLCFTDDVVYIYNQGNIVAFDVHSEATMEQHHSTSTHVVLDICTLGLTVAINDEGKTAFEGNVERGMVILLMEGQLEILVGLESKCSVHLQYGSIAPMCTWYDTVLVQVDMPGSVFDVLVYRVKISDDGLVKQVSLDHIQTCHLYCSNGLHAMSLTGNKALLLEGTNLMIWDISVGEECRSFALTSKTPVKLQKGIMSWIGTTVAVAEPRGPRIIILYHLDDECENLQMMTRLNPKHSTVAFHLLYDESILVTNKHQCDLVLYKNAKSTDTDDILECTTGNSEHDGGNMKDSFVPESRNREQCESDEAKSYKSNLSYLMGISEEDLLWNNFDAELKNSDCQPKSSNIKDSDWSEQSPDSGSVRCKRRAVREESIFEQSRYGMIPHDVSSIAKPPVKHKCILSLPEKHDYWNYFFTDSGVVIDAAGDQLFHESGRIFVYEWR